MPTLIETGEDGSVFVVGSGVVYEFDPQNGAMLHMQSVGTNLTEVRGVAAEADYIYITGRAMENLFGNNVLADVFIAKYDRSYNLVWGTQYTSPDSISDIGQLCDFGDNYVYVVGDHGSSTGKSILVAFDKYTGAFVWFVELLPDEQAILPTARAIDVDEQGNVYTGHVGRDGPTKVDSQGNILWQPGKTDNRSMDIVYFNGRLYVLMGNQPNKILLIDAQSGILIN